MFDPLQEAERHFLETCSHSRAPEEGVNKVVWKREKSKPPPNFANEAHVPQLAGRTSAVI